MVPDRDASCSLVESCAVEPVRAYRQRHPDHVIVSYINTSVEVKAESDILCTSRNAVQVVNSIPADKTVLFLPDQQPGQLRAAPDRPLQYENLAGHLHRACDFPGAARGRGPRASIPDALIVAHPECPQAVLDMADFIGSTSAIIDWCVRSDAREFIVMTESGVGHSLRKLAPDKIFHFVANENCNCSECPYMRLNTLEKLRDALQNLEPRVEIADDLMRRARVPLDRMLALR